MCAVLMSLLARRCPVPERAPPILRTDLTVASW
jgi:hypothetical protein